MFHEATGNVCDAVEISCVHDGRAAARAIMSGETPAGYQSDDSIDVRIMLQPKHSAEMQERSGLTTKEGIWG